MAGRFEAVTIYLTATGEIVGTGYKENGVYGAIDAGKAYVDGLYEPDDTWINGTTPTDRPALIDDEDTIFLETSASAQTLIASIPIGTVVVSEGFVATAATAQALNIVAARAGEWEITVTPPFPSKKLTLTVFASNAN